MKIFFLTLLLFMSIPAYAADDSEDLVSEATMKRIAVLISAQIRPCWKIPSVANPMPLQAVVDIDTTGHLSFVEFTSEIPAGQEELAKSVEDAIADPKCNPIKNLPPQEIYEVWKNLTLLFAPKN